MTTNGNTDRTTGRSAGRGMLVDGVSEEKRAEMAVELAAEIREKRRTEWNPE